MKKLFLVILLMTAVAAGNMFGQTAAGSSAPASEKKQLVMKGGSKGEIKKHILQNKAQGQIKHKKALHKKDAVVAGQTKKEKLVNHKSQVIQKAGGKSEAKAKLKKKQLQRIENKKDE